jgi:enoyl-CoA hydratase/carnithine racemase
MMTTAAAPLLSHLQGHTCVVTLNRPKALNSLNTEMCDAMTKIIRDANHAALIVKGSGGKAFCAGGDVKQIWQDGQDLRNDPRIATGAPGLTTADFFRQEYIMNHAVRVEMQKGNVASGGKGS